MPVQEAGRTAGDGPIPARGGEAFLPGNRPGGSPTVKHTGLCPAGGLGFWELAQLESMSNDGK